MKITIDHIISVVCASTGISRAEVTGDKRSRAIVQASTWPCTLPAS